LPNAYTFSVVDTSDLVSASIEAQIEACAEYVISLVAQYIAWQGMIDFVVNVRPASELTWSDADGLLPSVIQTVWDGSGWFNETLAECVTGIDPEPGRPDAGCTIYLARDGTIRNYGTPVWFDPAPQFGVDPSVPQGTADFIGIFTHEVFHSLGFIANTTQWRELVSTEGKIDWFFGEHAVELLGTRVAFGHDVDHYGYSADPSVGISRGLMYEFGNYERNRFDIGRIDLAILEDLGHTIKTYDGLPLFELLDYDLNLTGTTAADRLYGDYHVNTLSALDGDDLLDGGGGPDSMIGGAGNDIYMVDNSGDSVAEAAAGGMDAVRASISYALGANLENLTLTGAGAIDGTGNALANLLIGNGAANVLNGSAGADTMQGGAGNDIYLVDNAGDQAIETLAGDGVDRIESSINIILGSFIENLTLTGTLSVNGTGNNLANELVGNGAANRLDGAAGADTMRGGAGHDLYVVDNVGDQAIETLAIDGSDTVQSSVNFTLGAFLEKLVLTGTAVNGTGNALANQITGNAGANRLDGGVGADLMWGGAGNDTYVVDASGERAIELNDADGIDSVEASATFALGAFVENLTLTGVSAINGTGNGLANTIVGNAAANILNGSAGADTLRGGAGDDRYVVDNAGDQLVETNAADGLDSVSSSVTFTLSSNVENLTLTGIAVGATGNNLDNFIVGNDGANQIDGKAGADLMRGNGGNDTYAVDNVGDRIVESDGGGSDLVNSTVSFTLASFVENLTLTGAAAVNGNGNAFANFITGNAAANVLDGKAGADLMRGGAGNDTYIVDNVGDRAVEALAADGTDTVNSSISFTLGGNLENLTLTGAAAINATGNSAANSLTGNAAANVLNGMAGGDTLVGGGGGDDFLFTTALGATNVDEILDLQVGIDDIVLENAVFAGLVVGPLDAGAFRIGSAALDADDRILYDSATGALYFDRDGTGSAAAVQFATLDPGLALSASEFQVI